MTWPPEGAWLINEDRMGLSAGLNFYVYADNNSPLFNDPYALWKNYCQRAFRIDPFKARISFRQRSGGVIAPRVPLPRREVRPFWPGAFL
jgi:hypothetical protein